MGGEPQKLWKRKKEWDYEETPKIKRILIKYSVSIKFNILEYAHQFNNLYRICIEFCSSRPSGNVKFYLPSDAFAEKATAS